MSVDRTSLALRVDVLGPLALWVEGRSVAVPGARRRALLAVLALGGGRHVSAASLVESLWPDESPDNAVQALYSHVSRLRGHLGPLAGRLQRTVAGYRLDLEPDELDVDAARRQAARLLDPGLSPAEAADLASAALQLWRGRAFEDLRDFPVIEVASVELDELHLRLVDDRVEARIALGDRAVVPEAARAAAASPLRERTALAHVRALAVDGRTAEAMAAGQAYRSRLVDETGLDPGPALAELEQRVASGALGAGVPADGAPHVLARPDGPLVGRQHDLEEVLRLMASHTIVTITGPGGVGKTRLALEVAADPSAVPVPRADVVLVELAAVDRPERVCQAVASTLGLRTSGEVRPRDVAAALAERDLLLVLDNCEHLVDACRELVVTVRRLAPGVRVLATSRETLHAAGEYVVRLQPLPVPRDASDLDALRRQPSVRAFLEHARRRRADYQLGGDDAADIVEVLRRLDGLPLGIELAARQVAVMPLSAVRDRLDRALDLATGGHDCDDDRQRTLRATIASSYRLLGEDARRLLRALAPFPGGVDLHTVEALARGVDAPGDPLDLLHRLVDASLVVADPASARYRLLFTVRTFLLDALRTAGELAAAETQFLDRSLALAHDLGRRLAGPDEIAADRLLREELDNLRAARDVALAHGREDVRVGITIAVDDAATWRGLRELWAWALELAEDPTLAGHPDHAAVLGCAAEAARLTGDLERATRLAEEALAVAGPDPEPHHVRQAWSALAAVAHFRGDFAGARARWLRADEGQPVPSGTALGSAALATSYAGDPEGARELLDRAHAANARSQCGSHVAFVAYVEGELRATGQVEEAIPHYLEAIEKAHRTGAYFFEGVARVALASAQTRIGDVPAAADGFAHLIASWRRSGQLTQLWTTARNAADLLARVGRTRTAALLLLAADDQPAAAAVGPRIARFSGRVFLPVTDLVPEGELAGLRVETRRLGPAAVLDLAATELRELARAPTAGPAA